LTGKWEVYRNAKKDLGEARSFLNKNVYVDFVKPNKWVYHVCVEIN
jgi:hypothetical protein